MEKKKVIYGQETKYERIKKLGSGAFGEVFLVERLPDRQKFVAKVMRDHFDMAKTEAERLRQFHDEHIVGCIEYFPDEIGGDDIFVIIMEYCDGGTLEEFIEKYGGKKEHTANYLRIAQNITDGLSLLHSTKQLHRDIKPVNILISGTDPNTAVAKLADLGLGRDINPSKLSTVSNSGTIMYFSPERLRYEKFSFPADIWALGMSIYELLAGKDSYPFPIDVDSIMNKPAASLPAFVPGFFSDVVLKMLEKAPERRITSKEAMVALLTGKFDKVVIVDDGVFVLNLPKTGIKKLDSYYEKEAKFTWCPRFFDAPASPITRIDLGDGDYYYGETKEGKPHGRGAEVLLSIKVPGIRESWYNSGKATGNGRFICETGDRYEG